MTTYQLQILAGVLLAWAAWGIFRWLQGMEKRHYAEQLANRKRAIRLQLAEANEEIPEPKRGGFGSNTWTVKRTPQGTGRG